MSSLRVEVSQLRKINEKDEKTVDNVCIVRDIPEMKELVASIYLQAIQPINLVVNVIIVRILEIKKK